MSSNVLGLLILLFAALVSINIIMAMRSEPFLLAWLNQIILGIILITVVSYAIVAFGTRKAPKRENALQKEEQ